MIKGGGLKKYVITRWTTAYDCTDSIIRCKNALKQILENESQLLNLEIISILRKQNFFRNVKDLRTILLPIKKAIINLEHKSTTLADCFINLVIMATAIKELSQTKNNQFENNEGENQISNSQNFDSFFNVTDIELRRVLEIEVTVEIPLSTEYTDSGEQDFNIESIINKSLERRESGINNITE
ncbi:hypothetical protein Glove_37g180 [Diversispora epigaea]|uniref:Uncharacterized protein n=1 Tax=Diversispora epigaea TaxID=1348612 RepID=A0A397JI84_9GLOM|nr:hypothetical protein Glove_37g180 [Diversispora epigaea]